MRVVGGYRDTDDKPKVGHKTRTKDDKKNKCQSKRLRITIRIRVVIMRSMTRMFSRSVT